MEEEKATQLKIPTVKEDNFTNYNNKMATQTTNLQRRDQNYKGMKEF